MNHLIYAYVETAIQNAFYALYKPQVNVIEHTRTVSLWLGRASILFFFSAHRRMTGKRYQELNDQYMFLNEQIDTWIDSVS